MLLLPQRKNDFLKLQISSILGSALDYLSTIVLAECVHFWYLTANLTGNLLGGSFQFFINRIWTFKKSDGNLKDQAAKFILVFAGNILLSAAGVYLLTSCYHIDYLLSKTLVSVLLGLTYNYFFQKKFVFKG
jgi:putative flippase GtrA